MSRHTDLCALAQYVLEQHHTLTAWDLGPDAHLAAKGFVFDTQAWDVEGAGHLCSISMRGLFGLMRMETIIIAPTLVDQPLINLDYVWAMGNETQIVELYDTQLQPWPNQCQAQCAAIKQRDDDIPDAVSREEHWYDELMYPCSYHKKARGKSERFSQTATDYLVALSDQIAQAAPCDNEQKAAKVRAFAEQLYAQGGPAVNTVTKLFGSQTARRLVVRYMYGAEEA